MREIKEDPGLVAKCGLYCGACGSYLRGRCPGCAGNDRATWCRIRSCCAENRFESCADCGEFADPMSCRKFNNPMSKIFGFIFRSDRAACIRQIRKLGVRGHACDMASRKRPSLPRKGGKRVGS